MRFTNAELAGIAARAATLGERLARGPDAAHRAAAQLGAEGATRTMQLAERWRDVLGGQEALERRLAWAGFSPAEARAALAPPLPRPASETPGWARILDDGLAGAGSGVGLEILDPAEPLAFEELLVPFVEAGAARLRATPGCREALSADAWTSLRRGLLRILSFVGSPSLMLELSLYRHFHGPAFAPPEDTGGETYRHFLASMRDGGLRGFLVEYAVVARLLAGWVESWTDSAAEMLGRLRQDWGAVRAEAVQPYLSDPHHGGRSVAALRLASGERLIYKPRPVDMESAFFGLVEWIASREPSLALRAPRVLCRRAGYGWVEAVEPGACASTSEVEAFYHRAGALLCLLHALAATDAHVENLIASGGQPVLVDAETLLHPFAPGRHREGSVLRTGLLGEVENPASLSGLTARGGDETPFRVPRCRGARTDGMELLDEPLRVPLRPNLPRLGGRRVPPEEHADDLVAGFEAMFGFLARERATLLAEDGPFARFAGRRSRFVLRSTNSYGLLAGRTLQPELLGDGAARGVELERFLGPAAESGQRPPELPLLLAEQRALERMDVPAFTVATDRDRISSGEGDVVEGWLGEPGSALARKRLEGFMEFELARQKRHLREALGRIPAAVR